MSHKPSDGPSTSRPGISDDLVIPRKDLIINTQDVLGKGAFSIVCGGRLGRTPVAVKVFNEMADVDHVQRIIRRELEILSLLRWPRHPNVVDLYGIYYQPRCNLPCIVMENCTGGSLFEFLERAREAQTEQIKWPLRVDLLFDLVAAMAKLHDRDIAHCDLRSPNLLIHHDAKEGSLLKLADFGLSR